MAEAADSSFPVNGNSYPVPDMLNPISPAFTSSMDLARTVVQEHFRA